MEHKDEGKPKTKSSKKKAIPPKSSTPQPSNNSKVATATNSSSEKVETPTTSPSPQQPSNVETSNDNIISDEFKTTAVERMTADQIYNALVNNDHQVMASLFFALSDLPQQMQLLKTDFSQQMQLLKTDLVAQMNKMEANIREDLRIINTNIGCLYEGQVKLQFQKDDDFITENPVVLKKTDHPDSFASTRIKNHKYSAYLTVLCLNKKISVENAAKYYSLNKVMGLNGLFVNNNT
nr:unnamed protein product [Naegleria fowleri]